MSEAIKEYHKKPLVVRAIQWDGESHTAEALRAEGVRCFKWRDGLRVYNPGTNLMAEALRGDYIILAPTGCRYPVKADQFERNYDPVGPADDPVE